MQKLCERLNIIPTIKNIEGDTIPDIINKAFKYDCYRFYLNSELIDVNNRFRIFEYKNKKYIVKKTIKEDGKQEIESAHKAIKKLNNIRIDGFIIKIVKPDIYYIDDVAYILTEYMGNSLQELNYSNQQQNPIKLNTILSIMNLFLRKGILYRGFLPRNTVVKKNYIYLLDWEDSIFNENEITEVNMLWKTNFLLNWSYFYEYDNLEEGINKIFVLHDCEPPLLKYEKKFKEITNLKYTDYDLRKCILNTIIVSEKKISEKSISFIIPPNDIAHLVSDLYNTDIDVLFDISSFILRKKSEFKYIELLKELSENIVNAYSKNENISKALIEKIFNFFSTAVEYNFDYNLAIKDKKSFFIITKKILNKLTYDFNETSISEEVALRITKYLYSFK